jgi:hypothetical protein
MPIYYLDSSAIVKRYVTETGSVWIRNLCQNSSYAVFISELALPEVGSAFARRYRRGEITDEQRHEFLDTFVSDCEHGYHLIPVERSTIERSLELTQQHVLRAYDAVQLACALAANNVLAVAGLPPLTFVSADDGLLGAATSEQFQAENPNHH